MVKQIVIGRRLMTTSVPTGIWQSYLNAFRRYFNISGYAARKEFWSFTLINILFFFLLIYFARTVPLLTIIAVLYGLFMLIPMAAITIRRFNDAGKSIWTLFLLQIISFGVPFVLPAVGAKTIQLLISLYILYILLRDTREHPETAEKATVGARIIFTLMYIVPLLLIIAVLVTGMFSGYFKAMTKYKALKTLNQEKHVEMLCPQSSFPFHLT